MNIILATLKHVDEIAYLFDQYRQFYEQPANYAACQTFIRQRLQITLETGHDNFAAQSLYESIGYEKDTEFYTYHFSLT